MPSEDEVQANGIRMRKEQFEDMCFSCRGIIRVGGTKRIQELYNKLDINLLLEL